jgi:hypothetical protein
LIPFRIEIKIKRSEQTIGKARRFAFGRIVQVAAPLVGFHITGLFGLYSHKIDLKLEQRITIIIGPNGRGKTVCLKFIEALFREKYSYFVEVPFKTAQFIFADGERIVIESIEEPDSEAGAPTKGVRFIFNCAFASKIRLGSSATDWKCWPADPQVCAAGVAPD